MWPKSLKGELENNSWNQRTYLENWHCDRLNKRFNLLFLRVRKRREIELLMMKMMMRWEPVCHQTKWQRHCVLRTVPHHMVYIALSTSQKVNHEGREWYRQSMRHIQQSQMGITPPSWTSIWFIGFPIRAVFSVQLFCDWGRLFATLTAGAGPGI
jgi:hypothetical protein